MEYRVLRRSDAKAFQALRLLSLKDHPEAFGASLEEEVHLPLEQIESRLDELPARFVLGAFSKGQLVGFAGFYQNSAIKMRHRGSIWGVYVDPANRRKGISRQLIRIIIQRAENVESLEFIDISVNVDNEAACRLYISCGFICSYIEPAYLKWNNRYFDSEHLCLKLKTAPSLM